MLLAKADDITTICKEQLICLNWNILEQSTEVSLCFFLYGGAEQVYMAFLKYKARSWL